MNRSIRNSLLLATFTVAALLAFARGAQAFPHLYFWGEPSNGTAPTALAPGGGNIYGTGGARDFGITCAHCHIKSAGVIDATISPSVAWQMMNGMPAYKPGQAYQITVTLTNEQKNPGTTNNLNGFALSIEDASGRGVGMFSNDASAGQVNTNTCTNAKISGMAETNLAAVATTYLISPNSTGGGCYTVVSVPKAGATSWKFNWTAPAAGAGPVTLWYGVVDGDTDGKNSSGDDVKQGKLVLQQGM